MKEALRTFWENRSERDRTAIGAAAILIALAIVYAYVWLPVTRERDRLLVRIPELRAEAQAMESDAGALDRLGSGARPGARDLKTAIEQAAATSRIALSQGGIEQQGAQRVRVLIASVRAAEAFTFVARLQSAQSVLLENLRMTSLADGDRVKLEAVFSRAP